MFIGAVTRKPTGILTFCIVVQCKIHNMRERLSRLAAAVEELAKHGKAKPDAERGLDDIAEKSGKVITKGEHYAADPLGVR